MSGQSPRHEYAGRGPLCKARANGRARRRRTYLMRDKQPARPALLKFDPDLSLIDDGEKDIRDGISAAVLADDTLWVACD